MARSSILLLQALQLYVQLLHMREPSPSRRRLASESRRVLHVLQRKQSRCHRLPAAELSVRRDSHHRRHRLWLLGVAALCRPRARTFRLQHGANEEGKKGREGKRQAIRHFHRRRRHRHRPWGSCPPRQDIPSPAYGDEEGRWKWKGQDNGPGKLTKLECFALLENLQVGQYHHCERGASSQQSRRTSPHPLQGKTSSPSPGLSVNSSMMSAMLPILYRGGLYRVLENQGVVGVKCRGTLGKSRGGGRIVGRSSREGRGARGFFPSRGPNCRLLGLYSRGPAASCDAIRRRQEIRLRRGLSNCRRLPGGSVMRMADGSGVGSRRSRRARGGRSRG